MRPSTLPAVLSVTALLAAGLILSGCAAVPAATTVQTAVGVARAVAATPPATPETAAVTAPEPTRPSYAGPWEDPTNPLYQRTIYFDGETVEIKPEYLPTLRIHASYLGSHAERRVTLAGHTDARGSREYNLSLGEQRADAVRRFLLAEGVPPNQMAMLSYGEERPANVQVDETAWRANRRVVIKY